MFLTLFLMLGGVASAEIIFLNCTYKEAYMGYTDGSTKKIEKGDDDYINASKPSSVWLDTKKKTLNDELATVWDENIIKTEHLVPLVKKIIILNRNSGEYIYEARNLSNNKIIVRIFRNCSKSDFKKKF